MIFNYILGIWCAKCKKYLDPYVDVYQPDGFGNEGRICCLIDDEILGYTWDLSWREFWKEDCKYYYEYHNQGTCRCVQEACKCGGRELNCDNELGKKSYEADLKEEK